MPSLLALTLLILGILLITINSDICIDKLYNKIILYATEFMLCFVGFFGLIAQIIKE